MRNITFDDIVDYYCDSLTERRKKEVEDIISNDPYYILVLEGLFKIEGEMKGSLEIKKYLEMQSQNFQTEIIK